MRRRGMILILSSPSGAGKTTLTRMLLQDKALDLTLSISVTTRPRRSSRGGRRPLSFHRPASLRPDARGGDLLESAEVHGSCYGTPRAPVDGGARGRARHAVRHRLAGRAAGARDAGRRRRQHLHPAALDERTARPARAPRRGFGRHDRDSASTIRGARSSAGGNTTTSSSTTTSSAPTPKSRRSSPPNARKGSAWRRAWRGLSRRC